MLVLARSAGQSVVLDDRITVTVLATHGGIVRLGIAAPGDVGVRRGELDRHPSAGRPDPSAGRSHPSAGGPASVDQDPATRVAHVGDGAHVADDVQPEGAVAVAPGVVDVTDLRSKSSPSG
jgi:carbon storage regulator